MGVEHGKGVPKGWNFARTCDLNLGPSSVIRVSLTSTGRSALPLHRPDEPCEVQGIWTRSSYTFQVQPELLVGRFRLEIPIDIASARITRFSINSPEQGTSALPVTPILTSKFTASLLKAAFFLSTVQGRWTPPGEAIFLKDGQLQTAPSQGHFTPLRADYRKPRIGDRHWEDTEEIDRIVELQKRAHQLLNAPRTSRGRATRPRSSNQDDIEKWIAEQSRVWSPGTVHRQLQIARNTGKITRKKLGRKKST